MRLEPGPIDSDVQSLLDRASAVRRLPDPIRARALARARAAMVAEPRALPLPDLSLRAHRFRLALAASVAVAVGAAGAAAALRTTVFATRHASPAAPPAIAGAAADVEPAVEPAEAEAIPAIRHPGRFSTAQESYRAEVALLQRAQAAYADRNFNAALALVTEHGRRFPKGRLAEEREALRVRSLAGAGRVPEARRATVVFAHRFPRSVLIPRLQETVSAAR